MTGISEALLIKKMPLGESDIMTTLFTKQFGKIRAAARNAATSRKRFGGRLEPFALIRVETALTRSGGRAITDAEVVKSFENIAKKMEVFLQASCVLEFIDAAVSEEESPCEEVFAEAVRALEAMDGGAGFQATLNFQTAALGILGYGVDFSLCGGCGDSPQSGVLVFPSGLFLCGKCARKSRGRPARKAFSLRSAGGALENIKCLNAFVQYQTGKELKSAKLLENMLNV